MEGTTVRTVFFRRLVFRSLLLLLVFLVIPIAALAQTSTLQGTVLDPQARVVPGADVVLTSKTTGIERTTVSDDQGKYLFAQVAPGLYQVRAELSGFKTVVVDNLRLLVDTPASIDLRMSEVGDISETVIVTAEKLLNKVDASVGNAFNEIQIKQLPIESRNVYHILALQPGVTLEGYVAGARSDQSNLTLDGIDVNEQQTGEAFGSVLRVTPDSVQEFRVTTSNPNASQGRSSGAQVSLITKSGTNQFHGNLFEFHRNTVTTANDFFNNRVLGDPDNDGEQGIRRPNLIRNLYGGSLGGPIARDKLFFFFNYEGRKDRKQESVLRTVPLPHLGDGSVKYINTSGQTVTLNRDQINALYPQIGGVNPAALKALKDASASYPANTTETGDQINTGGYRFNASMPLDWNYYVAKIDYMPIEKHTLSIRGNYQWDHSTRASQYFPDTETPQNWSHPTGLMAAHTWTMSNSMLNTFRYGITRQAFSAQGDSNLATIFFRDVFQPASFSRTLNRTTPVHNFTNDFSWTNSSHTLQFGMNIRLIKNNRESFASAFDTGIMNFLFYDGSGQSLVAPITDYSSANLRALQKGMGAVLGRYTQYSFSNNYGADGSLLPAGAASGRTFGTEEYEFYGQDSWRVNPSLTLTYGLRWSLNTPVYETQGYQVKPNVSLGNYFELRKQFAAQGIPYNESITIDMAGPKYNKPGWYDMEWANLAPRIGAAWSPSFDGGVLGTIFGSKRETVIRGGFGMLYDRIGSALAVSFDLNNTLGFSSTTTVSANTFNVTDRPGPLFTGYNQDLRTLPPPGPILSKLTFPLSQPADERQRIEQTLDDTLTTPVNYNWNLSWGRELPHGLFIEGSYMGRAARNLLATRDIMHLNNIVDPKSGMDWYTAAGILEQHRVKGTPVMQIPAIPFFDNLFPAFATASFTPTQRTYRMVANGDAGGLEYGPDYTYIQLVLDDRGAVRNMFFHPQYAALAAWSTVAYSDYHAFTMTARERYKTLTADFNYTWSKSMDNASGLQNEVAYGNGFIMNPLRPDDAYSISDFDVQHMINSNWLWQLPVGKGRQWITAAHPVVEGILGGWDLNGIFRWNNGLPARSPFMSGYWPTNWNLMTNAYRMRDPGANATKNPKPNADGSGRAPNLFPDPVYAHQSLRTTWAGESGDRNVMRRQGYVAVDLGVRKSFAMPNEGHSVTFMWDVFNVTNTQRLGGNYAVYWVGPDPFLTEPEPNWYNITNIQGSPRVMQFALRYEF
jgi:hypothetical protein